MTPDTHPAGMTYLLPPEKWQVLLGGCEGQELIDRLTLVGLIDTMGEERRLALIDLFRRNRETGEPFSVRGTLEWLAGLPEGPADEA
jgi:hypothetical protein